MTYALGVLLGLWYGVAALVVPCVMPRRDGGSRLGWAATAAALWAVSPLYLPLHLWTWSIDAAEGRAGR